MPSPHLACPLSGCSRWFYSVSGLKKHTRTQHSANDSSEPPAGVLEPVSGPQTSPLPQPRHEHPSLRLSSPGYPNPASPAPSFTGPDPTPSRSHSGRRHRPLSAHSSTYRSTTSSNPYIHSPVDPEFCPSRPHSPHPDYHGIPSTYAPFTPNFSESPSSSPSSRSSDPFSWDLEPQLFPESPPISSPSASDSYPPSNSSPTPYDEPYNDHGYSWDNENDEDSSWHSSPPGSPPPYNNNNGPVPTTKKFHSALNGAQLNSHFFFFLLTTLINRYTMQQRRMSNPREFIPPTT
jgi:hypothetical protein